MYHFRMSGLPNVWLANGFQWVDTDYGRGISFQDIDGLHDAITRALLVKGELTGREFRFLRVELDLSQGELGTFFGRSDQTVALWEKGRGAPPWVQRILRGLVRERSGRAVKLFDVFQGADAKTNGRKAAVAKPARLNFEKPKRGAWRLVQARQRAAA